MPYCSALIVLPLFDGKFKNKMRPEFGDWSEKNKRSLSWRKARVQRGRFILYSIYNSEITTGMMGWLMFRVVL